MESYNAEPDIKWKLTDVKSIEEQIVDKIVKDKGFSEPDVILQKIKKIRKKKDRVKNNYKNIELFENINEPKIVEGLSQDGIARFKNSDYVGGEDDIYEGGPQQSHNADDGGLAGAIERFFNKLRSVSYKIAHFITKNFSTKKDYNHRDVYVIQKYVGWSFSILLSCYIVYNWVFIMFYKDETGKTVELPVFLDRGHFDLQSTFNVIYRLANYFIRFSLFFPEKLQEGIKYASEKLPNYFNASVCFSVAFFFIVFGCYHSLDVLEKFLLSIVKFDYSNPVLWVMYGILFMLVALSFFEYDVNPFKLVSNLNPVIFMVNAIISFLRYAFILFMGVPIAAILCFFYILIYSFFGIILLNGFDFKQFSKIFGLINDYCKKTQPEIRKETPCEPYTVFERFLIYFNIGFDFIYKNVFTLAFAYLLVYGLGDYWILKSLKSQQLTVVLVAINAVLLFSLIMNMISYKPEYKEEPGSEPSEPTESSIPKAPTIPIVSSAFNTLASFMK